MPRSRTAQSSPAPITTEPLLGSPFFNRSISSNSFTFLNRQRVPDAARQFVPQVRDFLVVQVDEKVRGVKTGVRDNRRDQRVGRFEQKHEDKRQHKQWN